MMAGVTLPAPPSQWRCCKEREFIGAVGASEGESHNESDDELGAALLRQANDGRGSSGGNGSDADLKAPEHRICIDQCSTAQPIP
jgi:hypothetical protein